MSPDKLKASGWR